MSKSKPYIPAEFPPKDLTLEPFIKKIVEANRGVALFDGVLRALPNYAIPALDAFFRQPVIDTKDFLELIKAPKKSGIEILNKLVSSNLIILKFPSKGNNPAVYEFVKILDIINA
jgi:hypothetical protein